MWFLFWSLVQSILYKIQNMFDIQWSMFAQVREFATDAYICQIISLHVKN